jgi:hypothetical protein
VSKKSKLPLCESIIQRLLFVVSIMNTLRRRVLVLCSRILEIECARFRLALLVVYEEHDSAKSSLHTVSAHMNRRKVVRAGLD